MVSLYKRQLQTNLWKFFLYILTQRRHYITILAIYFLTLPNTTAQQIGIYAGLGVLASFLFEIPSGYFADHFGHKRTLVLSKILIILSTTSFILADSLAYFIAGSIFLTLSVAFASGTKSAFMHETLIALNKEKDYTKIMSKIIANVSFLSAILIVLLPFFTAINILLPLQINLAFDALGLVIAFTLVQPKQQKQKLHQPIKKLFSLIAKARHTGFYPIAIFTGLISGFLLTSSNFRYVYAESLGFPIILIGSIMGLSRFFWFIIGHYAHLIEKTITLKKLLLLELFFFPGVFLLAAYLSQPYVVGIIFALSIGYYWGRSQIITHHFLKYYIKDRKYKATMLSIKGQISMLIQLVVTFLISYVMHISYKLGYFTMGLSLFILLVLFYPWIKMPKTQRTTSVSG